MARFWIVLPGVERGPGLVGWIRQMMREGQTLNAVDDAGTQLKVGRGKCKSSWSSQDGESKQQD